MNIIDRRRNPGAKNLPNRQRFLVKEKAAVGKAVADAIAKRKLVGGSKEAPVVEVTTSSTEEPSLRHDGSGDKDFVVPGNRKFLRGDAIPKPQGEPGAGGSGPEAGKGDGEDSFRFMLTADEFLDAFFGNLELPDLIKIMLTATPTSRPERAGFSNSGNPSSVNMGRSSRKALARRIALGRPSEEKMEMLRLALDEAEESGDVDAIVEASEALEAAAARLGSISWMQDDDLRYNNFEVRPKPIASAVMFCLMDVSASVDRTMKEMAKVFFLLLQIFLERRYANVCLVFIRHTETAEEVSEDAFFNDPKTGGTLVSAGLEKVEEIRAARFPADIWNAYVAQASDGDAEYYESARIRAAMAKLLPNLQYFAYLETRTPSPLPIYSKLWDEYKMMSEADSRLAIRRVTSVKDVWPVFAELFSKHDKRSAT